MGDVARIGWDADGCSAVAEFGLVGGGIRQYICCDRAVVPLDTEGARVGWYSGTTLAPWPNRLAAGAWTWNGVQYEGDCNDALGHALHGLVYNARFEITDQREHAVTMSYTLGDDDIYPFPVRIDIMYAVHANGLSSMLSATNLSDEVVPIALGVHPYFPYAPDTTITTSATLFNENSANLIPTGVLRPVSELGLTTNAACALGGLSLDNCLSDLDRDATGRASTTLTYADGTHTRVWQDAQLAYTQVFTKTDFPWAAGHSGAIGIEPQTAPANALNNNVDLQQLQPGATWSVRWGIECA